MANNRMVIKCKCRTDRGVFLGKTHLSGYYTIPEYYKNETLMEQLNEYYDKHIMCHYEYDTNEMEIAWECHKMKSKEYWEYD